MSFLTGLPSWMIRIVCTLMTCIATSILLGGKGWEEDFDPPLSERERKLVRSGVLFEMAFQLGLWVTCLVANELGNTKVFTFFFLIIAPLPILIVLLVDIGLGDDLLNRSY